MALPPWSSRLCAWGRKSGSTSRAEPTPRRSRERMPLVNLSSLPTALLQPGVPVLTVAINFSDRAGGTIRLMEVGKQRPVEAPPTAGDAAFPRCGSTPCSGPEVLDVQLPQALEVGAGCRGGTGPPGLLAARRTRLAADPDRAGAFAPHRDGTDPDRTGRGGCCRSPSGAERAAGPVASSRTATSRAHRRHRHRRTREALLPTPWASAVLVEDPGQQSHEACSSTTASWPAARSAP